MGNKINNMIGNIATHYPLESLQYAKLPVTLKLARAPELDERDIAKAFSIPVHISATF